MNTAEVMTVVERACLSVLPSEPPAPRLTAFYEAVLNVLTYPSGPHGMSSTDENYLMGYWHGVAGGTNRIFTSHGGVIGAIAVALFFQGTKEGA